MTAPSEGSSPARPSRAAPSQAVPSPAMPDAAAAGLVGVGVVGVGTDLVELDRLRDALERQPALGDRLFTPAEQAYAERHRDPTPHLGARFAAKEAVMKALGAGMSQMAFDEIEVTRDERGRPGVALHGRAAEVAASVGAAAWHLSLTHTGSMAHAVAVATGVPERTAEQEGTLEA